jgi:peptidoglycan/LPS O-acetylase OafA/YrhL
MKSYQESSINYRPDIDGLRALAVIAVLIFHFFPAQLNGGFAGVDIFFVISGYLVTNIIYLNTCKNNFSFINFYLRRIRRLFPSLIIILIFTLLVGWILLLADEFLSLGKHVLAGSTFTSNFLLYSESGYFDKRSELKVLLQKKII